KHGQANLARVTDMQRAEIESPRTQVEAWRLLQLKGQAAKKHVQSEVGIRLRLGLLSGAREIHAAGTGQELTEDALTQKVAGHFPFSLAAASQVFISLAAPAGRKTNLMGQSRPPAPVLPTVYRAQLGPVEVAEDRFARVGPTAAGT